MYWCLLSIAGVGPDYRSDICEFEWTMQRKHHAIWSAPGGLPVYRQVYQRIRSEILSGRLAGEGYTVSAGARGTVVNVALLLAGKSKPLAETAETGGKLRRSISPLPTPLLFRVGLPALDAFPRKQWTRIAARVARQLDGEQMANPNLHDVMATSPCGARLRAICGLHGISHAPPIRS